MNRHILFPILLGVVAMVVVPVRVDAGQPKIVDRWAKRHAMARPWHGSYYHTEYAQPISLVAPPTATTYSTMSWGVTYSEARPIYHQFQRPYPGAADPVGGQFLPTPHWPSHTDQFGVYYVRGPW